MNEWISIKDRLPEDFGWFLVIDEYMPINLSVTIGFYEGADSEINWLPLDSRASQESMVVTHWMPLPEPPKDVK